MFKKKWRTATSVLIALAGTVALIIGFAGSSTAAPYTPTAPVLFASTTNPVEGDTIALTGTDFVPGTTIGFTLFSEPVSLGSVIADDSGSFSVSVTLPQGITGTHVLEAAGDSTDTNTNSASVTFEIAEAGGSGGGGGNSGDSDGDGGLASTGVAVAGIGVAGLVLLFGGAFLMMAGRRRKAKADA